MCVFHHQGWFRRPDLKRNCRGHGLHGVQFLRDEQKGRKQSCCCSHKICMEIGYSMYNKKIPPDMALKKQIVRAMRLCLSKEAKERILDPKQTNLWIAPWHFFPEVRTEDPVTHEWTVNKFGKDDRFYDAERVEWTGFPPPNYNPELFKDLEIPKVWEPPTKRWKSVAKPKYYDLPAWTRMYRAIERPLRAVTPTAPEKEAAKKSRLHKKAMAEQAVSFDSQLSERDATIEELKLENARLKTQTKKALKDAADAARINTELLSKVNDLEKRQQELVSDLQEVSFVRGLPAQQKEKVQNLVTLPRIVILVRPSSAEKGLRLYANR